MVPFLFAGLLSEFFIAGDGLSGVAMKSAHADILTFHSEGTFAPQEEFLYGVYPYLRCRGDSIRPRASNQLDTRLLME